MAIDLTGSDPFGAIVAGDDKLGDIFGAGSAVLGGDWLGVGLKLLGGFGSSEVSGAASIGQSSLNTSGYVVGKGKADGGALSNTMQSLQKMEWYVWAAGALVAIAIIKKAV